MCFILKTSVGKGTRQQKRASGRGRASFNSRSADQTKAIHRRPYATERESTEYNIDDHPLSPGLTSIPTKEKETSRGRPEKAYLGSHSALQEEAVGSSRVGSDSNGKRRISGFELGSITTTSSSSKKGNHPT